MNADPNITIVYDGGWPNLCSGTLVVTIDGTEWNFGKYVLESGGSVTFDAAWNECVSSGYWSISKWPEGFPAELKDSVTAAVNKCIPLGCCGGCV